MSETIGMTMHDLTAKVVGEIGLERVRQVEAEGCDAKHDDEHDPGELACAGAAYALEAGCKLYPHSGTGFEEKPPEFWLWEPQWWKPKDPRRDLIRAAALIVAEIERIDRNTTL